MDKEKDNPIEIMGKLIALQDERVRRGNDLISKAQTLANTQWLLNHKACCENIAMLLISNCLPCSSMNERQRLIARCYNEIIECNKALEQLGMDTIKDEIISKLAEMASYNNQSYIYDNKSNTTK